MPPYDRTAEDIGNIVSLDHLNLTVADQQIATAFYVMGLGLTRDPYLTVGLDNMWVNAGRQQFHLPTRPEAQAIRGEVGLVLPDLAGLRERLGDVRPRLVDTKFEWADEGDALLVTCPWGNRLRCTGPSPAFGAKLGVPYIEFHIPDGSAPGIARFYSTVLGGTAWVDEGPDGACAAVRVGPDQLLVFREKSEGQRTYDGHHIAIYIADFSSPYVDLRDRGLVTEESNEHQYRFTDIVDPETNETLYELEHEVRSLRHPMFQRPLVNRDPAVVQASYRRGAEYLVG